MVISLSSFKFSASEQEVDNLLKEDDQETIMTSINEADYVTIQDKNGNDVEYGVLASSQKMRSEEVYYVSSSIIEDGEETKSKKTKTLTTNYYVISGTYSDYVGKTTRSATYKKLKTTTGQPYYSWSSVSGYTVKYKENGFRISSSNTWLQNTAKYKGKSKVKQRMSWYTNKSGTTTSISYFYAPANK